jgi:hypothetical protein
MKTEFLLTLAIATLLPAVAAGQSEWEVIRLDNNISFSFPLEYKRGDTLGQDNFLASTKVGYLQAVKIPQPQAQISNEKELIAYYDAFQKMTIEQSYGDLLSDSTIRIDDLYSRVFKLETYWNDTLEVQENMIVLIDHSMYSFTYAHFKYKRGALKERNTFFSGITIHNSDFEDQLTIPNKYERSGEYFGYVFRYVFLAGIVLAITLWFLKKYEQVRIIKNFFAWTLLTWGAVCLFLYIGNVFFSNNVYSLLIMGVVCLPIGFLLRKMRVPHLHLQETKEK